MGRLKAQLRSRCNLGAVLQMRTNRGRRVPLNDINGVVVFSSPISTTLIALLLELLLSFGICKAKQKLDTIFAGNIMELSKHFFSDVPGLEPLKI